MSRYRPLKIEGGGFFYARARRPLPNYSNASANERVGAARLCRRCAPTLTTEAGGPPRHAANFRSPATHVSLTLMSAIASGLTL